MREFEYAVCEDPPEWALLLDGKGIGRFKSRQEAFAGAVAAARQSRAAGHYAWVRFRPRAIAVLD